jgi:hypothetical protein
VENFNAETKKYELGKQQIFDASFQEIKDLLTQITSIKESLGLIPARIVSKEHIFSKLDDSNYYFENNYSFSLLIAPSLYTDRVRGHMFKIEDFDKIVTKSKKSKGVKITNITSYVLDRLWLAFPILNIITLIKIILAEIKKGEVNFIIISFMFWLIAFCVYSIIFSINKFIKFHKNPQKILIRFDFPLLNFFNTLDASEFTIITGQIAIILFTGFYDASFSLWDIIYYSCISISLISNIYSFIKNYKRNKNFKEVFQKLLFNKIHSDLKTSEKQYYLQLAVLFKNKPLISVEKIPKFFTLLSVLLTFIPIATYFFIIG